MAIRKKKTEEVIVEEITETPEDSVETESGQPVITDEIEATEEVEVDKPEEKSVEKTDETKTEANKSVETQVVKKQLRVYRVPQIDGPSKLLNTYFYVQDNTVGQFTEVQYMKNGFGMITGYVITENLK